MRALLAGFATVALLLGCGEPPPQREAAVLASLQVPADFTEAPLEVGLTLAPGARTYPGRAFNVGPRSRFCSALRQNEFDARILDLSKAEADFCGPEFTPIYGSHARLEMTDNCKAFIGTSSDSTDESFDFYLYVGCGPTSPKPGS